MAELLGEKRDSPRPPRERLLKIQVLVGITELELIDSAHKVRHALVRNALDIAIAEHLVPQRHVVDHANKAIGIAIVTAPPVLALAPVSVKYTVNFSSASNPPPNGKLDYVATPCYAAPADNRPYYGNATRKRETLNSETKVVCPLTKRIVQGASAMARSSVLRLLALVLCAAVVPSVAAAPAAQPPEDWQTGNLIANGDFSKGEVGGLPEGWVLKAPNPALQPQFRLVATPGSSRLLEAAGNGRAECFGCLARPVELASGKTYRLCVRFRCEGIGDVNRHLLHGVFGGGFNDGIFSYRKDGEWVIGESHFAGPSEPVSGEVRLYFRYSPQGKVWWSGVSLQECAADQAAAGQDRRLPRGRRPQAMGGIPRHRRPETLRRGPDDGVLRRGHPDRRRPRDEVHVAKGRTMEDVRLWHDPHAARRRGLQLRALWDRQGQLVGIYDKFMLYDPELDDGTTPGESIPVFQTDFGTVGIMTCYDSWHSEVARLLAYKGAELILFPSAGYYMQLMHARAADNGVAIAASSGSPCGVWDSAGNQADGGSLDPTRFAPTAILACEKDDRQKIQIVTLDLSKKPSPHYWGGPMLSAPGGRRVRATGRTHLEDEIARESRRWWETPPDGPGTLDPRYQHASPDAYERWRDLKYGLRIHWGIYSQYGFEASWPLLKMSHGEKQEYVDSYKRFNPIRFDAEAWMRLFERCGLKCFAFTTKHHDGFAMWDTKTRVVRRVNWTASGGPAIEACDLAYGIMETPFKRDIVKELLDAAHKHGIAADLYFSHIDWFDADFRMDQWNPSRDNAYIPATDPEGYARFARRHREQIRELLSDYGPVDMLCLDMSLPDDCWPQIKETVLLARQLQPELLLRERGIGAYGDYTTPENWIPHSEGQIDKRVDRPWMVIHTLSGPIRLRSDRVALQARLLDPVQPDRHRGERGQLHAQHRPRCRRALPSGRYQAVGVRRRLAPRQWRGNLRHASLEALQGRRVGPLHPEQGP